MTKQVKAIFFDIDGTLVSFKTHQIPESTRKALKLLREKDIKLFIATGRHKAFIDNLGDEIFDAYVTVNGQLCISEDQLIYQNPIDANDIKQLVHDIKEKNWSCLFVGEKDFFINTFNDITYKVLDLLNFPHIPTGDAERAIDMPIYQVVAFVSQEEESEFMKSLPNSCATRWHPEFIDVVPKGGNKQVGIDQILAYYQISLTETASFGDGENDISMLTHTPISVAMGNANDKVKASATYVTDDIDNDGLYNALKKLEII